MRRIYKARQAAQLLLSEIQFSHGPIDVRNIARKYARVVEMALDPYVSGVLVPQDNDTWVIIVNREHPEVRKRFTIAHELGHLKLHSFSTPHADRTFKFRDASSSNGSAREEIEANQFAAELLMPADLVRKAALEIIGADVFDYGSGYGYEPEEDFAAGVQKMARRFAVSQQAMTIRLSSLFA